MQYCSHDSDVNLIYFCLCPKLHLTGQNSVCNQSLLLHRVTVYSSTAHNQIISPAYSISMGRKYHVNGINPKINIFILWESETSYIDIFRNPRSFCKEIFKVYCIFILLYNLVKLSSLYRLCHTDI